MTEFNNMELDKLPKPSHRRGNVFKLSIITLIIVTISAVSIYWLSSDETTKEDIAGKVRENVDNVIKDTPLETVATLLDTPPPPPTVSSPPVNEVIASTTQPPETDPPSPPIPGLSPGESVGTVAPKVEEDSMVPMAFVEDAAQWMVSRYTPGKGLSFGIAATNLRYGQSMRSLMPSGQGDVFNARQALLRYAFNPPMLTALYNLYADRFVAALGDAAEFPNKGKALDAEQTSAMYKAYAKQFQTIGSILQGIAATPNFQAQVKDVEDLGQQSVDIHSKITTAVFDLDMARENKDSTAQEAATLRIDGLNAQYQRVLGERDEARQNLVNSIQSKAAGARGVDADTIIFLAEWIERRQLKPEQAIQSVSTAANLLSDLSSRLNTAANN